MAMELHERGFPMLEPLDTRPFKANPQGHYESWEVRDWDEKISRHFRMDAVNPGLAPAAVFPPLRPWLEQKPDTWVAKDPRLAIAWPVWLRTLREMGREDPLVIWCRRDIEEQVTSLQKYNINEDQCRWIVTMYECIAMAAADTLPSIQVWLDDPLRVDKASDFLVAHGIMAENVEA